MEGDGTEAVTTRPLVRQTLVEVWQDMAKVPNGVPPLAALRGVSPGIEYVPGLSVIAGSTSHGKTSLLTQQILDWLLDPELEGTILVWSSETTRAQLWSKIIGNLALRKSRAVLKAAQGEGIPAEMWESAEQLEAVTERLVIIDETISAVELCEIAIQIAAEPNGLLALAVDFIQELPAVPDNHEHAGRLAQNRELEVGFVAKILREFGVQHRVPVLAASQFNRIVGKSSNFVPDLQQLRESGRIEQNASLVIGLRNEEMAGFGEPPPHKNANPALQKTYRWGDELEKDRVGAQMAVRREHEGSEWRLLEAFVLKNRYEGGVGTVVPTAFHPESGRIEPVHARLIGARLPKAAKKVAAVPEEGDDDDDFFAPA